MKDWKRITLAIFVLMGSTVSFAFLTLQQFNDAFKNLSASSVVVSPLILEAPTSTTTTSIDDTATSTTSSDQDDLEV